MSVETDNLGYSVLVGANNLLLNKVGIFFEHFKNTLNENVSVIFSFPSSG